MGVRVKDLKINGPCYELGGNSGIRCKKLLRRSKVKKTRVGKRYYALRFEDIGVYPDEDTVYNECPCPRNRTRKARNKSRL
jgi:hypothetical protein